MNRTQRWSISWRFIRVWQRNLRVYQRIWKINFLPPLLEPVLYIVAFGLGFGGLIGKISYQHLEISYVAFITPALLAINIMNNAFFENTYASFVRMYYQKTFDALLATPLSLEEVITGEIIWGATKSVIATVIMQAALSMFGLIAYPHGLLIIPLAFLGGIAFGSIGMLCTGIVPSIDMFNLPLFLFITPMFLFSGTFFPIDNLPQWAKSLSLLFPLTHLVHIVRQLSLGIIHAGLLWQVGYLIVFSLIFFPLGLFAMHQRLIK